MTFTKDRTAYQIVTGILDEAGRKIVRQKPVNPQWRAFGRPFRYKGEDGFMGMSRTWMTKEYKRFSLTLFYPLSVLDKIRL